MYTKKIMANNAFAARESFQNRTCTSSEKRSILSWVIQQSSDDEGNKEKGKKNADNFTWYSTYSAAYCKRTTWQYGQYFFGCRWTAVFGNECTGGGVAAYTGKKRNSQPDTSIAHKEYPSVIRPLTVCMAPPHLNCPLLVGRSCTLIMSSLLKKLLDLLSYYCTSTLQSSYLLL